MLNKLQQKVAKLQSSLDLQIHMQSELESELKEKNKEIDARGNEVLKSQIKPYFIYDDKSNECFRY